MGDRTEGEDRAFVDGVWGGGISFGSAIDCGKFYAFDFRKGVAEGSGLPGASGERKRGEGGSGGVEAFVWIWGSERVLTVFEGLSFVAGI